MSICQQFVEVYSALPEMLRFCSNPTKIFFDCVEFIRLQVLNSIGDYFVATTVAASVPKVIETIHNIHRSSEDAIANSARSKPPK